MTTVTLEEKIAAVDHAIELCELRAWQSDYSNVKQYEQKHAAALKAVLSDLRAQNRPAVE